MPTTLFSTDFEAETVGALPAGWTTANGSTWAISSIAGSATSGTKSLADNSGAAFDTLLRTGTADVATDIQTYSYRYISGAKSPCPVWRADAAFNNAYILNYVTDTGSGYYFKRAGGSYGSATSISFAPVTATSGDKMTVERQMLSSGVTEVRIWNATTGTRPSAATISLPADTSSPYTSGYSGVFQAGAGSASIDDYTYQNAASTAATSYTLMAPSSGSTGSASAAFTVQAAGSLSSAVTVTPAATGGGTFSPSSVTLAAGSNSSATFVYTPATSGSKSISTTNNGGLTDPAPITYSAGTGPVTVDRLNTALLWSPYNWDDDGTSHNSSTAPAYCRFSFTGTSLAVNLVAISGLSNYPVVRVLIDTLPASDVVIAAGATSISLATELASTTHTCEVVLVRLDDGTSGKYAGTNAVKIKSFVLDAGATISAVTPRTYNDLLYADSIGEGLNAGGTGYTNQDATLAFTAQLGRATDAEIGIVAYGGQAYAQAGSGDVPAFNTSYKFHFAGRSRLVGGVLSPAPRNVYIVLGTNPLGTYATQADVAQGIANIRAIAPSSRIVVAVPVGGYARAAITAAVAAAQSGGDANIRLLDVGPSYNKGLDGGTALTPSRQSVDSLHPYLRTHTELLGRFAALAADINEPRRFTVIAS